MKTTILRLCFLLSSLAAHAATFTVANTNDSGAGSLRAALAAAQGQAGADTIVFDASLNGATIAPTTSGINSVFTIADTDGVTVDATALSAGVKIDVGSQNFRHFFVNTGASLTLRGLTLVNGPDTAIFNLGTLTLTHCTLSGNSSGNGFAIYNGVSDGTVTLDRCTLSGYSGGAINNYNGTATLTHCTLSGNSATNGGAIYNYLGTATLTHCTFSGNSATYGGAIYNYFGTATLTHCTFSGNSASYGSAIFNSSETVTLMHCTVSGNFTLDSGAIFNAAWLTLGNSIVAGNGVDITTGAANGVDITNGGTLTRVGTSIVPTAIDGTIIGTGSIITTAPSLAPLGNYGGSTQTMPPLADSSALAATAVAGLVTDQRGTVRGAAAWTNDFSSGLAGATALAGGIDAGTFRLTEAIGGQFGTLILPDLGAFTSFRASFDYQFTATNNDPADGMSFSFGPPPGTPKGEGGLNPGHAVSFNIYHAAGGIKYIKDGVIVVQNTTALNRFTDAGSFKAVNIALSATGELTVSYKGAVVLGPVATGYTYAAGDRFTFGARTGGSVSEQRVDNVGVITNPVGVAAIGAVEAPVVTGIADAGSGTLREVVNAAPTGSTITFAPALSGQTIALTTSTSGSAIALSNKYVTIDATALPAGVKIDGGSQDFRIFKVNATAGLTLRSLTLANGGSANVPTGGAILNSGVLSLSRCTLTGNSAGFDGGGAVFNEKTATFTQCTFTGNSAGSGGAIENATGSASATLTHCTLALNQSTAPIGEGGGGAIYNAGAHLVMTACILSGNTSVPGLGFPGWGPDLFMAGGTIVANNCLLSNGANAVLTNGTQGNIIGVPAQLFPLASNGGPTQTIALFASSPARGAAGDTGITSDQRGVPVVNRPDIGAYESANTAPVAEDGAMMVATGSSTTIRVSAADAEGDNLTIDLGSVAHSQGVIVNPIEGLDLTVNITAGFPSEPVTVTYAVIDSDGVLSAPKTITLTIRPARAVHTTHRKLSGTTADLAPGAGASGPNLPPAGAKLASSGIPAIDDDGNIAHIAKWTSPTGKGTGLFFNNTCLAIVGGPAPVAGAKYVSFTDPVVDDGYITTIAGLAPTGSAKVPASVVLSYATSNYRALDRTLALVPHPA